MRSFCHVHTHRHAVRALLLVAATGLVGGACSSSKNGSAGTGATLSAEQVTLVDSVISSTEAFLVQYSAATPDDVAQFKPEALVTKTFQCLVSGTASVAVSGAVMTVSYASCNTGIGYLDGVLSVACTQNGKSVSGEMNGTVAAIAYSSDGGVAQSADISFNNVSLSTSGGQTAGSITIGGTTYVLTGLDYGVSALTVCAALLGDDAGIASGGDGAPPTSDSGGAGGSFTSFAVTNAPNAIAAGPDGNLWFTESPGKNIGRITTTGAVTEFPIPSGNDGNAITPGPDGNVWFTELSAATIARITPAGAITEFPPPANALPTGIVTGPDGNLWFTDSQLGAVGKMTTAGSYQEFTLPPACAASSGGCHPGAITAGPDGNLWFVNSGFIGKVTPAGISTLFTVPPADCGSNGCNPVDVTAGPDGNVWFVDPNAQIVGRVTPAGTITTFPDSANGAAPNAIVAGPAGNLVIGDDDGAVGQVTTAGAISVVPFGGGGIQSVAIGSDHNLWFTVPTGNAIGKYVL